MKTFARQVHRILAVVRLVFTVPVVAAPVFVALVLIAGCATPPPPEVFIDHAPERLVLETVDYRLDERGRMIVPVLVNGQGPFDFILDTASSRTLVFENVRRALEIEFIDDRTTFVHGATLSQRRPILPIEEFRIGSLTLEANDSFSLPDPVYIETLPGGVLGMDFMRDYAIFVSILDQRIHFGRTGFQGPVRDYVSVEITYDDFGLITHALPFIPAAVQGHTVEALFDLGSEGTLANWPAANVFGFAVQRILRNQLKLEGALSTIALDGKLDAATISVGNRVWEDQRIDISNLPIFKTLNRAEVPTIIVSANLLRGEDMVIDFPAARLWLRASPAQRRRARKSQCRLVGTDRIELSCDATRLN
ncbi:MAG: retropepsin-like aspartic protease [Pseudomonadota bacterium]